MQTTMMALNVPDKCESKTIEASKFEGYAHSGWRPVALFEQQEIDRPNSYERYSNGQVVEPVVYKKTYMIIVRSEGNAIAEADARASRAESDRASLESNYRDMSIKTGKLNEQIEKLTKEAAAEQRAFSEMRADRDEMRRRSRKMEADLGKVRQALGDLRMREIIDGKAGGA